MADYAKPVPNPEHPELTRPFWEAAKQHRLVIPWCGRCSEYFWYPRQVCPRCLQDGWEWAPVSGKGRLYSFTLVYQPQNPVFNEEIPYPFAMIQLDEGVRIVSNIVDCVIEDLRVDMPLEVTFEDVTDEWTLFKFHPAGARQPASKKRAGRQSARARN